MGRPQKHEDCPGIAAATKMYNDIYRGKGGRQPKDGWEIAVEEVRSLDPSIQTVYVRKSRPIDGRTRERWEPIGKVCLACLEFWQDEGIGALGFADRQAARIMADTG